MNPDNHPSVAPAKNRTGGSVLLYRTQTRFYPFDPRPDEIHILDIAFNLSRLPRWLGGGDGLWPYSIGQHSLLVCSIVQESIAKQLTGVTKGGRGLLAAVALEALLHDAEEAYTNDLPSPIKHHETMRGFVDVAENLQTMIFKKFVKFYHPSSWVKKEVARADQIAAAMEMKQFISKSKDIPTWWPQMYHEMVLPDWFLGYMRPQEVEEAFLNKFVNLQYVEALL